MLDEIQVQTELVCEVRDALVKVASSLKSKQLDFERKNATLIARVKETATKVLEEETELRELAESYYNSLDPETRSNHKQLSPGVVIQDSGTEVPSYTESLAIDWALMHNHKDLVITKIDAKAFDKVALVLRPDFVAFTPKEPKATIASDLHKALGI